ncbi:hypothetical protein Tcan_10436 [Toxocara canis]|uniref:Uncharacterized protein n=1 Tax=Toxocara canis TaxID=6265 RepID=A0A0B2UVW8_TOXCA|nr:hypothetical protein Tcan_10436 [Toxocara canis]
MSMFGEFIAPVVEATKVRECWTTIVPASEPHDEVNTETSGRAESSQGTTSKGPTAEKA